MDKKQANTRIVQQRYTTKIFGRATVGNAAAISNTMRIPFEVDERPDNRGESCQ